MLFYTVSAAAVFVLSGVLSMAGLGAAFIFVPLFYYMGVALPQATSTALLLNVVSLVFATANYWRGKLINWRIGIPIMVTAVGLAQVGGRLTAVVNKNVLLALFAAFLVFAGAMMLFYRPRKRAGERSRAAEMTVGTGVGGVAGFLGGLLGVGGGNFIVPVLNWFGLDAKVAAGTTAFAVVFASLSGFLAHATVGSLNGTFVVVAAVAAAAGSIVASQLVRTSLSSRTVKLVTGVILWGIAVKMIIDLVNK
jgi:uncharacterized membrane protein YfcA